MNDAVSMEQFMELKEEVRAGFSDVAAKQVDLAHKVDMMISDMKEQNDTRYLMAKDNLAQAFMRLKDPSFRSECIQIGNDWANSDEGRKHIVDIINEHWCRTRDQAAKWISFAKLIGGIIFTAGIGYIGMAILRSQDALQALIQNAGR